MPFHVIENIWELTGEDVDRWVEVEKLLRRVGVEDLVKPLIFVSRTPLYIVVSHHPEKSYPSAKIIVDKLLANPTTAEAINYGDDGHWSPLFKAIQCKSQPYKNTDIRNIQLLVEGGTKLDLISKGGSTVLTQCVHYNNFNALEYLLPMIKARFPQLINHCEDNGNNALMLAERGILFWKNDDRSFHHDWKCRTLEREYRKIRDLLIRYGAVVMSTAKFSTFNDLLIQGMKNFSDTTTGGITGMERHTITAEREIFLQLNRYCYTTYSTNGGIQPNETLSIQFNLEKKHLPALIRFMDSHEYFYFVVLDWDMGKNTHTNSNPNAITNGLSLIWKIDSNLIRENEKLGNRHFFEADTTPKSIRTQFEEAFEITNYSITGNLLDQLMDVTIEDPVIGRNTLYTELLTFLKTL